MEPTIALVFSPELWVERLHRHLTDHGGARVRQIVLEPTLALEQGQLELLIQPTRTGEQTAGLERTSVSSTGFITGMYVVLTPLLALALFTLSISRQEQDAYALESQNRTAAAQAAGKFDAEIIRSNPGVNQVSGPPSL